MQGPLSQHFDYVSSSWLYCAIITTLSCCFCLVFAFSIVQQQLIQHCVSNSYFLVTGLSSVVVILILHAFLFLQFILWGLQHAHGDGVRTGLVQRRVALLVQAFALQYGFHIILYHIDPSSTHVYIVHRIFLMQPHTNIFGQTTTSALTAKCYKM